MESTTQIQNTCEIVIKPVDLSPRFDQPAYFDSIVEGEKYGTVVTTVSFIFWVFGIYVCVCETMQFVCVARLGYIKG